MIRPNPRNHTYITDDIDAIYALAENRLLEALIGIKPNKAIEGDYLYIIRHSREVGHVLSIYDQHSNGEYLGYDDEIDHDENYLCEYFDEDAE